MPKQKTKAPIYLVELDAGGRRWNVSRNGKPTGGFATMKDVAIGLAYREASMEPGATVWSVVAGKRKKEWPLD